MRARSMIRGLPVRLRVLAAMVLPALFIAAPASAQEEKAAEPTRAIRAAPVRVSVAATPAQQANLGPSPGMGEMWDPETDEVERDLGATYRPPATSNEELAATLSSITRAGSSPALVFTPELVVQAAMAASPELRATRAQAETPTRAAVRAQPAVAAQPAVPVGGVESMGGQVSAGYIDPIGALDLPPEMPAIHLPDFVDGSCERDEPGYPLYQAKQAWALAHYNTWRAYQLLEFIGESASQFRDDYWADGYRSADGDDNWSPRHWFGPWKGYRFDAIRKVVRAEWDRFRSAETGGIKIKLKCPTKQNEPNNPGNVCFTAAPPAHHVVKGYVNLCEGFFDESERYRGLLVAHELLHHTSAVYKEDIWKSVPLGDTHLHAHGDACLSGVKTEKMYGPDKILHLAATPECNHRDKNMANNDTYAWFITRLGSAVRSGKLQRFPTEGVPWDTPGGTTNECSEMHHPPPGPDIQDPDECFKADGQTICPGGGGAGGGMVVEDQCLAIPGPPGG